MKPQETKDQFIEMRAAGLSYAKISEALEISKSTCSEWERKYNAVIADLKQDRLNELYNKYYMTKEARINRLGETLAKIDDTLKEQDLSFCSTEKLLDFKLKYTAALKEEYSGTATAFTFSEKPDAKEIIAALGDLINRVRAGEITNEQAQREAQLLTTLLRAYDTAEVKAKLDALEKAIGGRG